MNDMEKKALGKRIRELREKLGLSQLELAKAVNKTSPAYIAFIEQGERNISTVDLMLIAKALGSTVSKLVGEDRKDKKIDVMQALRADRGLGNEDRKKIEEYYIFLRNKHNEGQ